MPKMTGAAAMHVMLLRISKTQDAYEVFGWKADTLYTIVDVRSRFDELAKGVNGEQWKTQPKVARKALFPVVMGTLRRIRWAMEIIYARLDVMDNQSGGETDMEA